MVSPLDGTLVELVSALASRTVSPVEVMEAVLDRIDRVNPRVNAVVAVADRDRLLAAARAAGERLARGEGRPLEGVPFGVKDLEDAAGLPTTHGSLPFKDQIADHDATQTARLKAAGAICVGKTNAPEQGTSVLTTNRVYGTTGNPWDPALSPGGSSGGASAAIAGSILPLVTASDGGGSIRIPASWVGAFGLKPSFGRVPRGPMQFWDLPAIAVSGPLTKTVADAALMFDQIVGPSADDPSTLPHPGYRYTDRVARPIDRKLRIGFSPDFGHILVQSDVAAVVEDAVRVFEKLGHTIVGLPADPPNVVDDWSVTSSLNHAAKLFDLIDDHADDWGRHYHRYLERGREVTVEQLGRMLRSRGSLVKWAATVFADVDLVLSPTTPFDAPPAAGPLPDMTDGQPQHPVASAQFCMPFNLTWNPAANVRAGLSNRGLPVGLHIVGPQHGDDLVLAASAAFERERPWHPVWPSLETV